MKPKRAMTDEERVERTARLKAARVAAGQEPTIQSPALYLLLAAIVSANAEKSKP
jgi:hypothetical protein